MSNKVVVLPDNAPIEDGVTQENQCPNVFDARTGLLCCVRKKQHEPPCHVFDPLNELLPEIT